MFYSVGNQTPSGIFTVYAAAGIDVTQQNAAFTEYFDDAENAFISAYRHHKENPDSFEIVVEYLACPSLENKTLILADPMLATGQSMVSTFEALKPFGNPKNIHLVSVIGAQEGVDYVNKNFSDDTHLWIATIDQNLNEKGYIIPGLGDAGDLAFGEKLQQ